MIRAVIFDLGGTLLKYKLPGTGWVEFETAGARAAHAHLIGAGHALPSGEAFVVRAVEQVQARWRQVTDRGGNLRLADLLRDLCAEYGLTLSPGDLEGAVRRYVEPLSGQARPLPGAAETLAALKERDLKIGLISNTMWPGGYHLADLARHGLDRYFDHTLFSADAGLWKPHPEVFRRSLAALEVAPREAVFVGDFVPHDVAGAQGVGMRGVHIATNAVGAESVTPDARIHALNELPGLIQRWREGASPAR
jgi:putative hydrolase of the HAD superfamily